MEKRNQSSFVTWLKQIKLKINIKKIALLSCLLLMVIFLSYQAAYVDKIYPGVSLPDGTSLANLTNSQAQSKIKQWLNDRQTTFLNLTDNDNDNDYRLDLTAIEFNYQIEQTASQAFNLGRNQTLPQNLASQFELLFKPTKLTFDYQLNNSKLSEQIASLAGQLNQPLIEPSISLRKDNGSKELLYQPGQTGRNLKEAALINIIKQKLALADFNPIELQFNRRENSISQEQIDNTIEKAQVLIDKELVLTADGNDFLLTDEDLISFLNFSDSWQKDKITDWLNELGKTVNRPAQNAAFKFENGRVVEFKPAKKGRELQLDPSFELLENKLNQLLQTLERQLVVKLVLTETSPTVETGSVNDLGIEEQVSQGISFFKGSIINRVHNVALAAEKINGVLIKPGETFSFNQTVGDISAATGFKQAYIIKDGKTILGDGGGVCQVSTTLFRAALNAGLEIIERRAHAYRVSYYEQNSEPGFDATVFSPSTDLKFKNNTPAHLLIQTQTNTAEKSLVIELYGRKDNRVITLSKAKTWDQTPPPPDLIQDDPTLPVGTVKQIDWKSWGAKVSFDYQVEKDGQILQQKTFYSNYRPWQAIFLKGTKEN